jgi:(p)ppGpp synthase/HD superfamily hydrolase
MSERKHDFWVRFDAAVAFASELHADQLRKGTRIPYVSHLFAVAAMVLSHGGSDDAAIAALLHDSLEDQGDSFVGGRAGLKQAIASRFGAAVLAIVEELTDDGVIEKPPLRDGGRPGAMA